MSGCTWLGYGAPSRCDRIRERPRYVSGAMTDHETRNSDPILLIGASGYVVGYLLEELLRAGRPRSPATRRLEECPTAAPMC